MLDRMGVPFNRTSEELLDFRRWRRRSSIAPPSRSATTGATAPLRARRAGHAPVPDDGRREGRARGRDSRARRWSGRWSGGTSSGSCARTGEPLRIGIVTAQDPEDDGDPLVPGRRGLPRDRRGRDRLRPLDQQRDQHRHRRERRLPAGACYANGEFIRVHPAIPGADKLRLISESARERGRVWRCRRTEGEAARARHPGEGPRPTSSRRRVPGLRPTSSPRDIASREAVPQVLPRGRGIFNPKSGKNENEVFLDVTHLPEEMLRRSCAGDARDLREVRRRLLIQNPMKVFPAVHYSMGGLQVDFDAAENGSAREGLAAQPGDEHRGALRRGRVRPTSTTAPIASAPSSLLSCIYAGIVTGPAVASYRQNMSRAAYDLPKRTFELAREDREGEVRERPQDGQTAGEPVPAPRRSREDDARELHDRAAQ